MGEEVLKEKFNRTFVNKSLKERRLLALQKFAEEDYQFILDQIREEMKQLKGERDEQI